MLIKNKERIMVENKVSKNHQTFFVKMYRDKCTHTHKWKQISCLGFFFYMLLHSSETVLQESSVGLIIIYISLKLECKVKPAENTEQSQSTLVRQMQIITTIKTILKAKKIKPALRVLLNLTLCGNVYVSTVVVDGYNQPTIIPSFHKWKAKS